jgi:hypothetical protein
MDVVQIVIYQNLTKLVQIVLGTRLHLHLHLHLRLRLLHNLLVVVLEHNTVAVLTVKQLKPAHNIPTVLIIL